MVFGAWHTFHRVAEWEQEGKGAARRVFGSGARGWIPGQGTRGGSRREGFRCPKDFHLLPSLMRSLFAAIRPSAGDQI